MNSEIFNRETGDLTIDELDIVSGGWANSEHQPDVVIIGARVSIATAGIQNVGGAGGAKS